MSAGVGALRAPSARAAEWPKGAFAASTVKESLAALYGAETVIESDAIELRAPGQVEDGALVPIFVSAALPDVESIAILVDKNPHPLAARVSLSGAEPFFGVHLRLRQTSEVHCAVRSAGKLYVKRRLVRVTVGG